MHCLSLCLFSDFSQLPPEVVLCLSPLASHIFLLLRTSTHEPASGFHILPSVCLFCKVFCFLFAGEPFRKKSLISSGLCHVAFSFDHTASQHTQKQCLLPAGTVNCYVIHSAVFLYRDFSLLYSIHPCYLLLCLTPTMRLIEYRCDHVNETGSSAENLHRE